MSRRRKYRSAQKTLGASPGTITYVGADIPYATKLRKITYNETTYRVEQSPALPACMPPDSGLPGVQWIDVDGIHEPTVIEQLGKQYGLHPLLLEDIVNTDQKPKLDLYDRLPNGNALPDADSTVVFLTLKMLHLSSHLQDVDQEHVSFVLGRNFLLSFQEERTRDIFQPVIDRIEASAGKTRRNGADYLLYALLDLIVDHYFLAAEQLGEQIDLLEEQIVRERAVPQTLGNLYNLKRELSTIRRYVYPVRDMIGTLLRDESDLIQPGTMPFLRDLYDHVNQTFEMLDSYRELVAGLMDIYYSIVSNRMNSIMQILTIISAIFIPLTFIAGVYGMNFDNMPELHTRHGYFYTLGAMVLIAVGEIIYFKRKGWM